MKYLFFFFLLISIQATCQDSLHKCPIGTKYFPKLSTSSMVIEGGCYPEKTCDTLWRDFSKNECEETSFGMGGLNLKTGYYDNWDESHTWSDSLNTCIVKYYHSINNQSFKHKRIEVTKDEFFKGISASAQGSGKPSKKRKL